MAGETDGKHISLRQQCRLIKALVKAKEKGGWDQEAANRLGGYMESEGIKSLTLRGYAAVLFDGGLYVEELPVEKYGLGAWLRVEYRDG